MKRILFVCIGNSIRSQMAEAFARKYGSDVMQAESVGLAPALIVDDLTKEVMSEVCISMDDHFSKGTDALSPDAIFDLVVNISGHPLPPELMDPPSVEWKIADPVGKSKEFFVRTRDELEHLVMRLVIELRNSGRVGGGVTRAVGAAPPARAMEPQPASGSSLQATILNASSRQAASSPVSRPLTPRPAGILARQSTPAWANLFATNPSTAATQSVTSEGQPLSRGMRRAIESGRKPQGSGGDTSGEKRS